jgi:hypothetical protein
MKEGRTGGPLTRMAKPKARYAKKPTNFLKSPSSEEFLLDPSV